MDTIEIMDRLNFIKEAIQFQEPDKETLLSIAEALESVEAELDI